jgi:hypothetical protein
MRLLTSSRCRSNRARAALAVVLVAVPAQAPLVAQQETGGAQVTVSRMEAVFTIPMPRRPAWRWSTSGLSDAEVEYSWEVHWSRHASPIETRGLRCVRGRTPASPAQDGSLPELVAQCRPEDLAFSTCGDIDCALVTTEPALHASSNSNAVVLRLGKSDLLSALWRDHPDSVLLRADLRAADIGYDYRVPVSYKR